MAFNIEKAEVMWKTNSAYRGLGYEADGFLRYFVEDIRNSKLPNTTVVVTKLKVGILFGGRREYLEIGARHLGDYRIFLGARAYGSHLSLSMFLVSKPGFWGKRTTPLNTFELQDLGDFLGSTQISFRHALSKVAEESGIDPKELKTEFADFTGKRPSEE